jgi:hypothetical protein
MADATRGVLQEYVKAAETMLKQEYGLNYTPENIEKLAMVLIERDKETAMEKEADNVIYRSFAGELINLGINPIPILKDMAQTDEQH